MADVSITKKPTKKVGSLSTPAVTWGSNPSWKATWKVPSALTSGKNKDRAQKLRVRWLLSGGAKGGTDLVGKNDGLKEWKLALNVTSQTVSMSQIKGRASWYPVTSHILQFVNVSVAPYNKIGEGPVTSKYFTIKPPAKPSVSVSAIDGETGNVTVTVNTPTSSGAQERYDTRYVINKYDSRTGKWTTLANTQSASASLSPSYDASDYQSLTLTQHVEYRVEAWARGLAGDSEHVTAAHVVAYPARATITSTTVTGMGSGGKLIAYVKPNGTYQHPVDRMRLQVLADTTIATAAAAALVPESEWDNVAVDNGNCSALQCDISAVIPSAGKHTWVRVKSWHDLEDALYVYSEPMLVKSVESIAPSASTTTFKLASVTPGADGRSAIAVIGWTDQNTGTELSWSEEPDTWESTDEPETHQFAWEDATAAVSGYQHSATIVMKKLDEGATYYVRARRYLDRDGDITYSHYSDTLTVMPVTSPSSVVLMCDGYVARGQGLDVAWSYDSTAEQKRWQLVSDDLDGTVIAEGTDPYGRTVISAERLDGIAALVGSETLQMHVEVSTGGALVSSATRTVRIVDAPVLTVNTTSPLTVQPQYVGITVTSECDLAVIVTADGIGGQAPYGTLDQMAGDVVWSGVVSPEYAASEWTTGKSAMFALPSGLAFHDGGSYTVSVKATDRDTGLQSETVTAGFTVAWAHQAPDVPEDLSVIPYDVTDADGIRTLGVSIQLAAPQDAAQTDVYDIYRVTGDGSHLVGSGYATDELVDDRYAPFGDGEHSYIVALRTVDGDTSWFEFPYELACDSLRFDFGGGYVELPWNVGVQDQYSKDFESRKHMDGSVGGYWADGVSRKAGLSTDIIRLDNPTEHAAVRELARHVGSVFVRTPNGSAYEANVDVSGMDASYSGGLTAVSIDAEEISPTGAFDMPLPAADTEDESEEVEP